MFGRRRRPQGLRLGTGDRDSFTATRDSNELAREILAAAQSKAESLPSGSEVKVELTDDHRQVHHMELMVSFLALEEEYGL